MFALDSDIPFSPRKGQRINPASEPAQYVVSRFSLNIYLVIFTLNDFEGVKMKHPFMVKMQVSSNNSKNCFSVKVMISP